MDERFQLFTVLVANINRSIRKIKTEETEKFNLKGPHVSCLYYLYRAETLTAKELCNICEEDKANVSRSIKYLEENGFLFCESKTKKRYQSPIMLTQKGKETGKYIVGKVENILEVASKGLNEEDRKNLYRSLMLISNNLQGICNQYEKK